MRKVTEEDFKTIKDLQKSLPVRQIILMTGRSGSTIYYAFKANSLEEMFRLQREARGTGKPRSIKVYDSEVQSWTESSQLISPLLSLLKLQGEQLDLVLKSLSGIQEQIKLIPKRRRF